MTEPHARISRLNWDQLQKALLATPGRASNRGGAVQNDLRDYFGADELAELRSLADAADRSSSRGPVAGNVIYIPGFMGSDLDATTAHKGNIWINYLRLAAGSISWLRLTPDGCNDAERTGIVASAMNKKTYAKAVLSLRARWNVVEYPFDWRKDIATAADGLDALVRKQFAGEPVHIVAHCMGGLVARSFIRQYPATWEAMQSVDGAAGGRLIMLGTPNYGSFMIAQVLTGVDPMLRLLARADLYHELPELIEITNTFVGSYQMLPSPARLPTPMRALYRRDAWGAFPVSADHLEEASTFHNVLAADPRTIDPNRMTYIAGQNRETLSGVTVVAPGEFDYAITTAGDGRVPHELGLLTGVASYFVDEAHGDLPGNPQVMQAVEDLLAGGHTTVLPATPAPARAPALDERIHWTRATGELEAGHGLRMVAHRAAQGRATPDEQHAAAETLRRAAVGADHVAVPVARVAEQQSAEAEGEERFTLKVEVAHGDITQMPGPLAMVGHYAGVPLASAVDAVDKALGQVISIAMEREMFRAGLGEILYAPGASNARVRPWMKPKAILIGGMGPYGEFSLDDLRYLMSNVATAAMLLRLNEFSTLLVGARSGSPIGRKQAVRTILEGVRDAMAKRPANLKPLGKLTFVARDPAAVEEIVDCVRQLNAARSIRSLTMRLAPKQLILKAPRVVGAPPTDSYSLGGGAAPPPGVRITVERDGDTFRFSALTESAVIPVREVEVQEVFFRGAAQRLMDSLTRAEHEQFGRLLDTYLMPEDFQRLLEPGKSLTLMLDHHTAGFPWEMACIKGTAGYVYYGPDLQLTRQFRTTLTSAPQPPAPQSRRLRILVIADPAPERELQLPGARAEGREVVRQLHAHSANRFTNKGGREIEVTERIGPAECDPIDILSLILSGDFDVIHFSGHGFFDADRPDRGGWVFGRGRTLSAREIFQSRRVPRLVFANACFSAVVNPELTRAAELNRHLAGLVEAFFDRGVPNYIGSGWPVNDLAAVQFASSFYDEVLQGATFGESVARARNVIKAQFAGSTWGAYQYYGQSNTRLVPPSAGDGAARPTAAPDDHDAPKPPPAKKDVGKRKKRLRKRKLPARKIVTVPRSVTQ